MSEAINCRADQTFQADLRTPLSATGKLTTPTLGAVTGIKFRLSATKFGAAIHAAVGDLAASERSGAAGRFYYEVDKALMETHVLPLGEGALFYGIWSKANDFDMESFPYKVAKGTVHY